MTEHTQARTVMSYWGRPVRHPLRTLWNATWNWWLVRRDPSISPPVEEPPCRGTALEYTYDEYVLDPNKPLNGDGLVQYFIEQLLDIRESFSLWVFGSDKTGRCFRLVETLDPASRSSFPIHSWNCRNRDTIGLIRTGAMNVVNTFLEDYLLRRAGITNSEGRNQPLPFVIEWPEQIVLDDGQVFVLFLHDGDGLWVLSEPRTSGSTKIEGSTMPR